VKRLFCIQIVGRDLISLLFLGDSCKELVSPKARLLCLWLFPADFSLLEGRGFPQPRVFSGSVCRFVGSWCKSAPILQGALGIDRRNGHQRLFETDLSTEMKMQDLKIDWNRHLRDPAKCLPFFNINQVVSILGTCLR